MGLLTPMAIRKCNSKPSKPEFNLKSLNKNIIANYVDPKSLTLIL